MNQKRNESVVDIRPDRPRWALQVRYAMFAILAAWAASRGNWEAAGWIAYCALLAYMLDRSDESFWRVAEQADRMAALLTELGNRLEQQRKQKENDNASREQ